MDSRNGPLINSKVKMPQTTKRNEVVLNVGKLLKAQKPKITKTASEAKFKSNFLNSLRSTKEKQSVDIETKPIHIQKASVAFSKKKSAIKESGHNKRIIKGIHTKVKSNAEFNDYIHPI